MSSSQTPDEGTRAEAIRRRYDSPLRRQRAAETRERIVTAGSNMVHALPTWDWDAITFRAVAQQAGVGQRTVYRYFPTERHLHDAIMQRLEEEAGVTYDGIALDEVASVAARVFDALTSFPATQWRTLPTDPILGAEDDRRRRALREAVERAAPRLNSFEREEIAAALDVLWAIASYERLVISWNFDSERATRVITSLIEMVIEAADQEERVPGPQRRQRKGATG
jgi:AcrR family transcriptional regulator